MDLLIKGILKTINLMGKVGIAGRMVKNMLDYGRMARCMAKEDSIGMMDVATKVITLEIKNKDKVFSDGLMVVFMRVVGTTACNMDSAQCLVEKANSSVDNGDRANLTMIFEYSQFLYNTTSRHFSFQPDAHQKCSRKFSV